MNYYNEWNAYRADWLRNLIRDGLIPDGEVDERGIEEVKAEDLEGFTQCHFFAGIGGWCEALRLARWFPNIPAWSGSCPCQPLSCAGKREGEKDVRHLWPVFFRLICKRRPPVVFGEQTASGDGPEWVAGVRLDLEAAGYRVGIANLPAAGVGAPHIRQRLWWVADAEGVHVSRAAEARNDHQEVPGAGQEQSPSSRRGRSAARGLGHTNSERLKGQPVHLREGRPRSDMPEAPGAGFWSDYEVLYRNEPKRGPIPCRAEPGVFPLVDGFPTRVEQVSAYGDAICPQAAAEFVRAFMDCR